jgi:GDP-D-mannose dehydratase
MVSLILEYVANVDGLGTLRILGGSILGLTKKTRVYQASTELYGGLAENKNAAGFMTKALLSTHVLLMERLRFMVLDY